jgi:hypothetical protein
VYVLDLESGREEEIFGLKSPPNGCAIERAAWSRDDKLVVARVRMSWSSWPAGVPGGRRPGGLVYGVVAADLERRELTFFRGEQQSFPTFLVEEPEVIEALKARSIPWQ